MTRTFWLSFVDPDLPEGQRFLGVAVIDVTEDDARRAATRIAERFPLAEPGSEWIGAATAKAHHMRCNPGGEVLSCDITGHPEATTAPRNRLMQAEELVTRGLGGQPS